MRKLPQDRSAGNRAAQPSQAIMAVAFIAALGAFGFLSIRSATEIKVARAHLESLEAQVAELSKASNELAAAVASRDADIAEARKRADLANERIEYYRDVLHIVAKTCPGRMKLPSLGGDPGAKR